MPNVEEKARIVEELRGRFTESPFVALTDFKGVTVKQIDKVRRSCEAQGLRFQVVKNTLCRRALQGTDMENLAEHFRGNVGVLFSGEDPIAAAKLLRDQLRENEKLVLKAGYFEGDVLDGKATVAVADLPGREELLAKLLATINEGPRQLVSVIQAPARDLLYLLNNFAAELEKGEGAEP